MPYIDATAICNVSIKEERNLLCRGSYELSHKCSIDWQKDYPEKSIEMRLLGINLKWISTQINKR